MEFVERRHWLMFVFEARAIGKKTSVVRVQTLDQEVLGTVKWYPPWRKYAFLPSRQTIFERTCLLDIVDLIERLMARRKREREEAKCRRS